MNEPASEELSAEARQLIAAARGTDDPTAEDEARVKARWLAGIAAGAGVSSLSEAVRAAASTGWSWGLKAATLAGAAGVAAVGVYLGWPESKPALPPEPAPQSSPGSATGASEAAPPAPKVLREAAPSVAMPEAAAPMPRAAVPPADVPDVAPSPPAEPPPASPEPVAAAPAPAEPTVEAPTAPSEPTAKARPLPGKSARVRVAARKAPAAPEPTETRAAAGGQLGEEIARISEIRGQLQSGSPARALEMLSEYRQRFAEPNLAMEADALQVDALCKAGQRDAARQAATTFVSRWPGSPLEQRVSSACQ